MKIIIDTNVLVSAILKNRIPEEIVFCVVENSQFKWLASSEIIAEYKGVLSRSKFKLPPDILQRWFVVFDRNIVIAESDLLVDFPRDQKDAKFLACAISHRADIFISGDKDFSEANELIKDTQIVSVTEFFNRFVKK
jgi:putative PIN family toxin of toxin-antitoxin system